MRSSRGRGGSALLVAVLLTACSGSGGTTDEASSAARAEQTCRTAVDQVVATTQRYVDAFSSDGGTTADEPVLGDQEYVDAVGNLRAFAASSGCDEEEFEDGVVEGLEDVRAGTPLARAVLLQLQAGDTTGPARVVDAAPGTDLARLAAALPSGSTIALQAGEHRLDQPLVLLRGLTLEGSGRDTTVLSSPSADGVLLVLTGEQVTVADVELRRTGEDPGGVVLAGPVSRLALTGTRVTGAQAGEDGAGGAGVLLAPAPEGSVGDPAAQGPQRPTTLTVTASELVGNESAGVVVSGAHRAEIRSSTVSGAGQCGVCFLETSDGLVEAVTLTDNVVGVVVAGTSRPAVTGSTVRGGEVSVQLGERGAPVVQGNELSGAARAAVIAGDDAGGRVEGNRCRDVQVGVVVGGRAVPFVGENDGCPFAQGQ